MMKGKPYHFEKTPIDQYFEKEEDEDASGGQDTEASG